MSFARRFQVDDIINFEYNGKTYIGNIVDFTTITEGPNGPFSRYIVVRSVINEKLKNIKIHLTNVSLKKHNVQLRFRNGMKEDTTIANTISFTE